jgi:prepilin-type N-terminal cleavage/methylation domain-containing protein
MLPERPQLNSRGFTLVETLAVIGVIVVLMGIAIPALSSVRAQARSTGCRTTLRELGLALSAYRTSMGDRIPSCEPLPAEIAIGETTGGLPEVLKGYVDPDCTCWYCAADFDEESRGAGTSYLYVPGLLRYTPQIQINVGQALIPLVQSGEYGPQRLELFRRNLEANELTGIFEHEQRRSLPLLVDSQDRHTQNARVPRNGLFVDGSVAELSDELGDLGQSQFGVAP